MKTILFTGFEPFGGESINPASEAVKQLDGKIIGGAKIKAVFIPVVQQKSFDKARQALEEFNANAVVMVGEAGGRSAISPERVAINIDTYRIPDNEGNQPQEQTIEEDGETAYWSTLPFVKITDSIHKAGIPAIVSNSADTYVCNHVFYKMMYHINKNNLPILAGFVHVPYILEQVINKRGVASMSMETIVKALEILAEQTANHLP